MNPEKFNIPPISVTNNAEYVLTQAQMKALNASIERKLINKDEDVVNFVQLILEKGFLLQNQKDLDEEITSLQDQSEELIQSPDSNTPEVLEQRRILKELTTQLLETQQDTEERLTSVLIQLENTVIEKSKQEEAEKLVENILNEIHNTANPPYHLN